MAAESTNSIFDEEDEEEEGEFYSDDEDEDVSPLLDAIYNGDLPGVQKALLDYGTDDIDTPDQDGYPPLILAAHYGFHDIVGKLLKNGAKADILAADGCSALLCGAQNGYTPVVETLLKNPNVAADPVAKDSVTPLYVAAQGGHTEICRLLLNHSKPAMINRHVSGVTPVLVACQQGHHDVVHLLISKGADISSATPQGATPLFIACKKGHAAIVNTILEYSSKDLNRPAHDGVTPLLVAIEIGNIQEVEALLDYGAEIELADSEGHTPLLMASAFGDVDIIEVLLEHHADTTKRDSSGRNAAEILEQEFGEDLNQIIAEMAKDEFPDVSTETKTKSSKKKKKHRHRRLERAHTYTTAQIKKKAQKVFRKYDGDASGSLDRLELTDCLDGLGCKKKLSDKEFADLVKNKLAKFDRDSNDFLDFSEFFKLFHSLMKHQKKLKRDAMKEELDQSDSIVTAAEGASKSKGKHRHRHHKKKKKRDKDKEKKKKKKHKKKKRLATPPQRDQSIWGVELMIRPGDIDMSGLLAPDEGAPATAAPAAATTAATTKPLKTPGIENMSSVSTAHVRVSTRVSEVLHIARQELQDGSNDLYKFGSIATPNSARGSKSSSPTRGVTTLPTL